MATFGRFRPFIDTLYNSAIQGPANLSSAHRQQIYDYAYSLAMGTPEEAPHLSLPEIEFIALLSFNADQISDETFEGLKEAGFNEDQILEILDCAALASGTARLDKTSSLMEEVGL